MEPTYLLSPRPSRPSLSTQTFLTKTVWTPASCLSWSSGAQNVWSLEGWREREGVQSCGGMEWGWAVGGWLNGGRQHGCSPAVIGIPLRFLYGRSVPVLSTALFLEQGGLFMWAPWEIRHVQAAHHMSLFPAGWWKMPVWFLVLEKNSLTNTTENNLTVFFPPLMYKGTHIFCALWTQAGGNAKQVEPSVSLAAEVSVGKPLLPVGVSTP